MSVIQETILVTVVRDAVCDRFPPHKSYVFRFLKSYMGGREHAIPTMHMHAQHKAIDWLTLLAASAHTHIACFATNRCHHSLASNIVLSCATVLV